MLQKAIDLVYEWDEFGELDKLGESNELGELCGLDKLDELEYPHGRILKFGILNLNILIWAY